MDEANSHNLRPQLLQYYPPESPILLPAHEAAAAAAAGFMARSNA